MKAASWSIDNRSFSSSMYFELMYTLVLSLAKVACTFDFYDSHTFAFVSNIVVDPYYTFFSNFNNFVGQLVFHN